MKERPIIMSTESVRAILAGRKTQTRRVCKYPVNHNEITFTNKDGFRQYLFDKWRPALYQVGDRLWVKEKYGYNIDGGIEFFVGSKKTNSLKSLLKTVQWKNPMFMPRHCSRITLEVTDVRLEKLQNLHIDDVIAEGIPISKRSLNQTWLAACDLYKELWDKLNAKRGFPWASNPWVWVIEFKRIEKEAT